MKVLTWSFVYGFVTLYDWTRVIIFTTVGLGRNADDFICTCRQVHLGHCFSGIKNWYWHSLNFICLDHVGLSDWSCRSGCFQVWWSLIFCFPLLSKSWCICRVASQGKNHHRRYLPLLLPIMSGRGQLFLRGRLSVWPFVVSRLDLCLRIPWRSVPQRMTMTHLDLFSGRLLEMPWRPEIKSNGISDCCRN